MQNTLLAPSLHSKSDFRIALRDAWDHFVQEFTIWPRAVYRIDDHTHLLTALGCDLVFATEEPVPQERLEKANALLAPDGLVMRRPKLKSKGSQKKGDNRP